MTKVRKKPKKNITKNINKKSFIQNTPNIAEKLDNEMVAFLDTEFLTSQVKGGPPAKLVSVGFVVRAVGSMGGIKGLCMGTG